MRNTGKGWVTAEYSMLPGSSPERIDREAARGRQSGRTQEIQRLIGRSLRAITDLRAMGEVQITLDCDVLQADGGTRTASICGAYVALHDACTRLVQQGRMPAHPLKRGVRGGVGGRRRGVADARSGLQRGQQGRGRHERGHDIVGSLRRGAGHRRRRALHRVASWRSCCRSRSTASPPCSISKRRCWPSRPKSSRRDRRARSSWPLRIATRPGRSAKYSAPL